MRSVWQRRCVRSLILFLGIASISACAAPEQPESPYAVGVRTLFIHDRSRPFDQIAGVNVGVRSLITEVWYPVNHSIIEQDQDRIEPRYPNATFGDYSFGDVNVHRKMMTQTTFFHLTPETVLPGVTQVQIDAAIAELFDRPRNAYREAPLADNGTAFPVVVMTHGDAGSRYNMETACEWLAANGYVVIAPEHTGNSPYTQASVDPALQPDYANDEVKQRMSAVTELLNNDGTYGPDSNFGQTYTPLASGAPSADTFMQLDASLIERVNDLRAALKTLDQWNVDGEFKSRLKLDEVGIMGRSFGGMTTLAALAVEPRFSAGVAVVPLVFPDVRPAFADALSNYNPNESALFNANGSVAMNTLNRPTMLLSGAEDALIINAGRGMYQAFGGPEPSPSNPHAQLRMSYEQSDQPVYWGLLLNSNHSSFGVSGGYWWPSLKPNTQTRTFNQDETFTLIPPKRAHDIQRERVLTFFDAYLKQSEAAKANLLNNPFSQEGFLFESRNTQ